MDIQTVRKLANREEVDYQFLLSVLSEYTHPRDKISAWLQSGDLIRVKKGLYVFGRRVSVLPYSLEILANLIYGPSAISLAYALAFYGLIPERVTSISSITPKRNKMFTTPVGEFTYQYLNLLKYSVGITLSETTNHEHFLIASKEKALCDYIFLIDKKIRIENIDEMYNYLFHDLRIDDIGLRSFNLSDLACICKVYNDRRLELLLKFIKKWKKS